MNLATFERTLTHAIGADRFAVEIDCDIRSQSIVLCVTCRGCEVTWNDRIPLYDIERGESEFINYIARTLTRPLIQGCTCWQRVRNEIRHRVRPIAIFERTNIPDWVGDEFSSSSLESRRSSSEIPTTVREPEIEILDCG